ncbi:hypothetical protein [Leptospira santarosai]|uniref:hypothetical protein n=1 Tax=Leptospira santarosai TaxID=28183 RepID=UPI0002BD4FE1|nr:hypothetical protein [Leptospira santarosai]EMO72420.1 hypothetical protein LEP1GSC130_1901 [Leptospira santarosai str. 200403458]EMO98053.1 hypothetical protein LEP1GSC120_0953 [Leptospira santarosai str. 200702252]
MTDYIKLWPDIKVKFLILATEEYIVFIDKDNDLDWITTEQYDKKGTLKKAECRNILNQVAMEECNTPPYLSVEVRMKYKRLLGDAIASALKKNYDIGLSTIESSKAFIIARNDEHIRLEYFISQTFVVLALSLILFTIWFNKLCFIDYVGLNLFNIAYVAIMGGYGSYFSTLIRLGDMHFDITSGVLIHRINALITIVLGLFSGIIIILAFETKTFASFIKLENSIYLYYSFIGFIAGISERLIPSIISKAEEKSINSR